METNNHRHNQTDLHEYVAKRLETIKREAMLNAETYGLCNQPPPDNQNIKPYWQEDHQKLQGVVDEVYLCMQLQTSVDQVISHKELTEQRLRDIHNKQLVAKSKGQAIEAKLLGRIPPYNRLIVRLAYIVTAILCLFDGIYNIRVFTAWGSGYAEAVFLGLFFAFLIAGVAHRFSWAFSLGKTLPQKRLIATTIFATITCLSIYMAMRRASYLEQQAFVDTSVRFEYSSIPFVIISMLIFSVSVAICLRLPSREQHDAMNEYQTLLSEKCSNDAVQGDLKKEEKAIEQEHLELRRMNASTIEVGQSMIAIVISTATELYALFKKHNMMYRKDNRRPPSFDKDGYPFAFNTNFPTAKNPVDHEILQ